MAAGPPLAASPARILVVDNYDSFTHNLYQMIGALAPEGTRLEVHRNDAIDLQSVCDFDPTHLILSPGPGHPGNARDFGVCSEVIGALGPKVPTLGVCLGHQGIVHHLGGRVVRAPKIVHGKTSRVQHEGKGLFAGLPERMEVMRYHSLIADADTLPQDLRVTARTDGGLIMAVAHTSWPLVGVQFHPESIGTPEGRHLMSNFLTMRARA